ncbi:MAG TPA: AAA family ATPase, partial [Dehalococcoidia bacterium]|nr:AAA family ATPase [Dehalococcoidia bacterium]
NLEVVVVDPDSNSRQDTNRALTMARFTVSGEAGYGIDAVTMAQEKNPDVIVLAMEEPVARASQTMSALADALPETPVIVYSSLSDAASVRRAMVSGARDYLVKPPRPEELARAIYSVLEQEERRRARQDGVMASSAARGTVITVFGAKGGIGKTTISTNLATALCRNTNSSIAIVDMDTRFGDVAIMMDVVVEYSIADVGRNIETVDRESIRDYLVQHSSGVQILPAPLHPTEWGALHRQHIARVIELLSQTHDYVVVDTPGAFNELVATALEAADIILLVTSMDIASIKDTALALEMLRAAAVSEDKVKLVINHSTSSNSLRAEDVERVLEYEVYWRIPHDVAVSNSNQLGQPIVLAKPYARASRAIMDMSYNLAGLRRERKGFLDRVLGR